MHPEDKWPGPRPVLRAADTWWTVSTPKKQRVGETQNVRVTQTVLKRQDVTSRERNVWKLETSAGLTEKILINVMLECLLMDVWAEHRVERHDRLIYTATTESEYSQIKTAFLVFLSWNDPISI